MFRVSLATTDPSDRDLLGFLEENSVTRVLATNSYPAPFEEYWYIAAKRDVLAEMIHSFWGDNGDEEAIEPV